MSAFENLQINYKSVVGIVVLSLVISGGSAWYQGRQWQQGEIARGEIIEKGIPDFSFTADPLTQKISTNGISSFSAHITFLNNFNSTSTNLWVKNAPAGITATYAPNPLPHQGVAVLTIKGNGAERPGTYLLTLGATSESITHTQDVALIIATEPDFEINISPATQTGAAGGNVAYEITNNPVNGFSDKISLSVSGIPEGGSAFFTPNPAIPGETQILTVKLPTTTSQGQYSLLIKGIGGTNVHSTEVGLNVTAPGPVWTISSVGKTGSKNNTVIVGPGRNDGFNHIYAGTVETGRIFEFTWNGTQWSKPIDIGGSPVSKEIHNMTMGPGRNDRVTRIYAGSIDGNIYELTYTGSGWIQNTVGTPSGAAFHAAVGNGRNDGISRLYAVRDTSVWEYTWDGTSWNTVLIGKALKGVAHGITLGDGRNDGKNRLYIASTGSGVYEADFSDGLWSLTKMGDSGDVRNVGIGPGRNDGIRQVYAALLDGGRVREFTWDRSRWKFSELTDYLGTQLVHAYVLPGRRDGVQRIYTSAGNGNIYEFTQDGSKWKTYPLGGGTGYMYGFHFGKGRNDDVIRLYGGSFNTRIYEYTWSGPY